MKAFLLAAGESTRLRPLTHRMPKCLLPVGGKPLLEIWLDMLERIGVKDVLINTHHIPEKVDDFLKHFNTGLQIQLAFEEELLGSAGTIKNNRGFVKNEPYFWIVYADSLTAIDLSPILKFHKHVDSILTLGLFHTDEPQRSGIVKLDEKGLIVDFIEKPKHPIGDLSNTGIMVASPELIDYIPDYYPCDLSVDVFPHLVGRMYGKVTDEFFIDIGTHESYEIAQRKWDEMKGEM